MVRTWLTNLVAWAIATLALGFFFVPRDSLVVIAGLSLAFAMLAPFWPEALGVAAGVAAIFFFDVFWPLPGAASTGLPATGVIAAAAAAIWRWRQSTADEEAPAPVASTRLRLIVSVLPVAIALLVAGFLLTLRFGFRCQSDTSHATPGSDLAAWCDTLSGARWAPLVFAPAALVLLGGIYFSARGRARGVLITVIAGFALGVAVHIPDFVVSNSAP